MSKESTNNDWRSTANKRRTRSIIGNEIVAMIEVYNDIPVAQLFVTIMRSKGKIQGNKPNGDPIYRDPYKIHDEEFLKELEATKEDLQKLKTGEDE